MLQGVALGEEFLFDGAQAEIGLVPLEAVAVPLLVRGVLTSAPTAAGMQEITVPLVRARPKAALFIVAGTTVSDGSLVAGRAQTISFTDGTNHRGVGISSEDAVATTNAARFGEDIAPIFTFSATGVATGLAAFSTWIDGGIRVDWLFAPASALKITAIFVFGDDVQAAVGTVKPGAIGDAEVPVDVGFLPDLVLAINALEFFQETAQTALALNFGIATRRGLNADQYGVFINSDDAVGISVLRRLQFAGGLAHGLVNDTDSTRKTAITSFSETGFSGFNVASIQGGDPGTTAGPTLGFLALALGGPRAKVQRFSSGAATGLVPFTGMGFKPQALLALAISGGSVTWAGDTIDLVGGGGALGIGFADAFNLQVWNGSREEDGVTPSEAKTEVHGTRLFDLKSHTGIDVLLAELDSFDRNGFTLDVATLASGPHALLVLGIEEAEPPTHLPFTVLKVPEDLLYQHLLIR